MQIRHTLLLCIVLGTLISCSAASEERGQLADYADAVYRLKGLQQTAADVRDICAASFPAYAAANQRSYHAWQDKEAPWLAEVANGYEQILRLKSGGNPSERKRILEQDAFTAKQSLEQTQKQLGSMPQESLAASCSGYSNYLISKNESDAYISAQLRVLRSVGADPQAISGRP